MNKNPQERADQLRREIANMETKIAELEAQAALEASYENAERVFVITRRSIDTGQFGGIVAVFKDELTAINHAEHLPGYGIGKDIFIDSYPLFS